MLSGVLVFPLRVRTWTPAPAGSAASHRRRPQLETVSVSFTFEVKVGFEVTQGTPTIDTKEIPGRFILHDANDVVSFVNLKVTITGGIATFAYTTLPGQQGLGKPVQFDLPMWLSVPGTPAPVPFPGQWSDSVTSTKEILAP